MNASAVERVELRPARSHLVEFGKTKQIIHTKTLKLHFKYVYRLAGRDFVNASPLTQIELRRTMRRTSGDSTNFAAVIINCVKSV